MQWTGQIGGHAPRSVCWSPQRGLFCAVSSHANTNSVYTSPDGVTWTTRTAASGSVWFSVCWSPALGLFCAVAFSGSPQVQTSPDGITWTGRTAAAVSGWKSVCWSPQLGLFCAVANSGTNRVMTSPDGITWTARTAAAANGWNAVCWSPALGLFCAVASNGTQRVMTSPDGITWTGRTAAGTTLWNAVCWSPELGLFCAVSGSDNVMTSPDGITWTLRTVPASNTWRTICWSPDQGIFCALAENGTDRVMTSADGIDWTLHSSLDDGTYHGVCWSPELQLFCAVAWMTSSYAIMTSPGIPAITGTLGATEGGADALALSGTLATLGTLACADAADALAASGAVMTFGTIAAGAALDGFAASGTLVSLADFEGSEPPDLLTATGTGEARGPLAVQESFDGITLAGGGSAGVLEVGEASDTAAALGRVFDPYDHLLPPNATPQERTLASLSARITRIPTPIDTVKRPYQTPDAFLPFLAWEDSVDIWLPNWSDARRRAVTEASLKLHFKKGTVYAIKEYLRYVGASVIKVERPPQKLFAGAGMSRAERERWLRGLPQVRVWLFHERGIGQLKDFGGSRRRGAFVELGFMQPSTALQRLHRRARYVVEGAETDVRVTAFSVYFRLHLRSVVGIRAFAFRPDVAQFLLPSSAHRRLVTIQPTPRLPWRSPVGPSLEPITSEPERVKVAGRAGLRTFAGRGRFGAFLLPSTAPMRVFDRYAVHDGRRVPRRPGAFFAGHGRIGFAPHTLGLTVSVPGRRYAWMAGEGLSLPRARFLVRSDARARVETARRAVQAAARATDKILLRIGPRARFVAGRPFIAGIDRLVVATH